MGVPRAADAKLRQMCEVDDGALRAVSMAGGDRQDPHDFWRVRLWSRKSMVSERIVAEAALDASSRRCFGTGCHMRLARLKCPRNTVCVAGSDFHTSGLGSGPRIEKSLVFVTYW